MAEYVLRTWLAVLLLALGGLAHAGEADDLLGRWRAVDAPEAIVEIRARDGLYQGYVSAHESEPERVGTHVLRDLHYDAGEQRWRGRVYAVRRDRVLDMEIVLNGTDGFTLIVSTLFGDRRVEWERVP